MQKKKLRICEAKDGTPLIETDCLVPVNRTRILITGSANFDEELKDLMDLFF